MFWKEAKFKQGLYNFVDKIEKYDQKMKFLKVDFQKPWWDIILKQKTLLIFIILVQLMISIFDSLFPLVVGYTINAGQVSLFILAILARLLTTWIYNMMFHYNAILQNQTMGSVEYAANQFFLTVDPVYHSTKSSGQIVSKVNRGSAAYENLLDVITFDLLGIVISLITVLITMFAFGWVLGLTALFFILVIAVFNITTNLLRSQIFEPIKNEAEDQSKAVNLEILQQAQFIRTSFATTEQLAKSAKLQLNSMITEANNWQSGTYVNVVSRTLYILSLLGVGINIFTQLGQGQISSTLAIAILLTYSNGTSSILYIGNQMKKLTKSTAAVVDLYDFIRGFGKQTYPVLEED